MTARKRVIVDVGDRATDPGVRQGKTTNCVGWVIFSIVLVNAQGGFYLGLVEKAGLLVHYGKADIWVGHLKMHNVDFPRDIPRRWVNRVRVAPGVERAEPCLVGQCDMSLPGGGFEGVTIVGVDRASLLGNAWNLKEGPPDTILQADGIIIDQCEEKKLEYPRLGEVREIGGRQARIVGKSHGIMGFLVTPYAFTTYDRAANYLRKDPNVASYYLVQLEPGGDVEQVCAAIQKRVPELDAHPKEDYSRISVSFWQRRTGLGISFGAATLLGLLVGMIMVAQTLYAMVLDRLGEFGTLKAIGATEGQVYSILLIQAMVMAIAGSIIGLGLVFGIQHCVSSPQAPIVIPRYLSLGSCALVSVICLISSLLPYLRIRKVDPMMVLQS